MVHGTPGDESIVLPRIIKLKSLDNSLFFLSKRVDYTQVEKVAVVSNNDMTNIDTLAYILAQSVNIKRIELSF